MHERNGYVEERRGGGNERGGRVMEERGEGMTGEDTWRQGGKGLTGEGGGYVEQAPGALLPEGKPGTLGRVRGIH
jgi:hypothetical protein